MATFTFDQLEQMARANGLAPEAAKVAAAIALAESRGNPSAISSTGDYGLWQINARSWPQFSPSRLLEPAYNARAMATIYKGSGWGPWATYKNGAYRQFLPSSSSSSPSSSSSAGAGSVVAGALGNLPGVDALTGLLPGVDSLIPGSLNPADWAGELADRILANFGKVLLGLLLGSAGIALAGYGIVRLTSESDLAQTAQTTAQGVGQVAALAAL